MSAVVSTGVLVALLLHSAAPPRVAAAPPPKADRAAAAIRWPARVGVVTGRVTDKDYDTFGSNEGGPFAPVLRWLGW